MTRKQLIFHILIPLVVILIAILSEYSGFDLFYARHFFDQAHHLWPYQSAFITRDVLHDGGKNFIAFLAILNLLLIVASFFVQPLRAYRKHLIFIFVAAASGPLLVGWLKGITHIHTPWDLKLFGGAQPYIRIFDPVPEGVPVGHAFPGGHASGGFAFISLYFLLFITHNKYRYHVLLFIVLMGAVFSATQEIRGAHFISHDLFSFAVCWSASLLWSWVFYRREYALKLGKPMGAR